MARQDFPPRVVRVVRAGQAYNGHFYQLAGGKVRVDSAYGSASQALGKGDPMAVAKRLMEQIVAGQSRF